MPNRIIIVRPDAAVARRRFDALTAALLERGHLVKLLTPRNALRGAWHECDCVITGSQSRAAQLLGYSLHRTGVPWIADVEAAAPAGRGLVLRADALTCDTLATRQLVHERLEASAALVLDGDPDAIDRQVSAVLERRRAGAPGLRAHRLRILMIGPVNSPHMEQLALAMRDRGHIVQAGGAVWADGLPPSALPDAGIPVSVMTKPQPLWLRRLTARFRPDVVHANWLLFGALATLSGVRPLVAMAWGSDVYLAGRLGHLANRLAVRRADHILADSGALIERLVELGASRERVGMLNWGVDLQAFRCSPSPSERAALRTRLGLADAPTIISPRGFKALYNPDVVLEAFRRAITVLPNAQLVLKHHGEQPPGLGALSGDSRVRLVGHVPYEQMADYFQAADVCVSIPDTDSSPRSVWEAMACGCACVLSDLPWVHEIISPGEHALVVSARPAEVGNAIIRLLTDAGLRAGLAQQGRRLVEHNLDAAIEMDRLEALYFRLAGGSLPAPARPSSIAESSTFARSPVSSRRE